MKLHGVMEIRVAWSHGNEGCMDMPLSALPGQSLGRCIYNITTMYASSAVSHYVYQLEAESQQRASVEVVANLVMQVQTRGGQLGKHRCTRGWCGLLVRQKAVRPSQRDGHIFCCKGLSEFGLVYE